MTAPTFQENSSARQHGAYQRVHPVRKVWTRRRWGMRHNYCAACGISDRRTRLETHHLVRFRRSDEPCNLLRLCGACHKAASGLFVVLRGFGRLPLLSFAACLALKKAADPEEWNGRRLAQLYGQPLPDPEPVPAWFGLRYEHWHGWVPEEFARGYAA